MFDPPSSLPGVCTLRWLHGAESAPGAKPGLVIEVPHGATQTHQYTTLRARLCGDIAAELVDFFHVNTDAGAPELADCVAAAWVAADPTRCAAVLVSEIPRTFIDCNRLIDASPESFREGKVTPGVPPWIADPADLALLTGLHRAYVGVATSLIDQACNGGGTAILLHTYAPRSVDVQVDADIVANLHHAYLPDVERTWPLRPEIDVIGRSLDGVQHVDPARLERLVAAFAAINLPVATGETYPLHPSTWAFHHATRHPGRTLCIEVRRDLLADPFTPFAQMVISPDRAALLGRALASAL